MPERLDGKTLDRFMVVTLVLTKVAAGMTYSLAVWQSAKAPLTGHDGRQIKKSVRTVQRWVARYQRHGIDGLVPKMRRMAAPSRALPKDFIDHLVKIKTLDPDASIPEVIRQAQAESLTTTPPSRVSVWRAAKRLNLPIFATKGLEHTNMRRFAFAHRMQMALADGKHFRAGIKSRKRVVITCLDDASRFVLAAAVGKSESSSLFLRCIWKAITHWGLPEAIFMDNGSAFAAHDVGTICARLGIGLVFGTEGYPEGRGKIERYHQTLIQDLLRGFRANPLIDADCAALEHRIEHYNRHDYNKRPHTSLKGLSPEARFLADQHEIRIVADEDKARQHFVIVARRKVSRDNIISVQKIPFEAPRGHAGTIVQVFRHLLDGTVSIIHDGKMMRLHPVDPVLNAHTRRPLAPKNEQILPPRTAATISYQKDHQPIVGASGDFFDEDDHESV